MRKRHMSFFYLGVILFSLVCMFVPSELRSQLPDHLREPYKATLRMMGEDNYNDAIPELKKIIQQDPQFSKAYRSLVEAYIYQDDFAKAQSYFESLLKEYPQNPYVYYALGRIALARKDYESAITRLKKAIDLEPTYAELYGPRGGLPEIYNRKKNLDAGAQYFHDLIERDLQNACSYYGLARIHIKKYELPNALLLLAKAVELDPELILAHRSIIFLLFRMSKYDESLVQSKRLLQLANLLDDFEASAYAEMMIGNYYFIRGDYSKALSSLHNALRTGKEIGDNRRQATCLNTIAAVYALSANFSKAQQYFNESLLLAQKTGSRISEVHALGNIANVYKDQGEQEQALVYYQRALRGSQQNNFKYEESLNLSNMAEIYQQQEDYDKAVEYQKRALYIATDIDERAQEAFVLRNLGTLNQDLGNASEAIAYLHQALVIGLETQDVQIIWESEAGLGSCYEKQGNNELAIIHYRKAIALYDSVRSNLNIEPLQNSFLDDKYEAYPSIVQLLARKGELKEAFAYAEKYKAKNLLDVLSQGRNLFNALLSDTLSLQLQIITAQYEEAHLKLSSELSRVDKDTDKVLGLDKLITELQLKRLALVEHLEVKHGPYYRLASPITLELDEIQNRILKDKQALLEYVLGPDKLTLFVVTSDTVGYSEIPLNRKRIRAILTRLSPLFGLQQRRQILNAELADFSIPPAYQLYELLIEPILPLLEQTEELILVPDDLLFYLPFEMIVYDTTGVETEYDFGNAKFLLEKFDISYVSSASLLEPGLQKPRKPNKGLLAVGNPDFGSQPAEPEPRQLLASKEPLSIGTVPDQPLVSLPDSETEVKTIGNVLRGLSNNILTGNRATEENFKINAPDYRILHLATHFLTNDTQPLYSKIALAQNGDAEEDGFLQTYEVFNMNLNADLVVLSACNTALGKLRKGEGVVGMSRAFQFAGVPSLVVSLWNVDDKATAIIMRDFYKYMKAGFNKKHALRRAKVDYLKASGAGPYYWAPFILIGDWQPLDLTIHPAINIWLIGIVTLLVIVTTLIIRKRMPLFR